MLPSVFSKGEALAPLKDVEENDQAVFRADAKASEKSVGIAGRKVKQGHAPEDSPRYAEEITEEQAPPGSSRQALQKLSG